MSNYNSYINDWHKLYGFSSHLHGMYHMEFFDKITKKNNFDYNDVLFSGIIGDAWSGGVTKVEIQSEKDIIKLGYSHGLFLDKSFFKKKSKKNILREMYFNLNKKHVNNTSTQIIQMMRIKIMLLSYLTSLPEYFGIPVATPFLNFNNVIKMLNLPSNLKKNRVWQKDYFKEKNLDVENMNLEFSTLNSLNQYAANNFHFEPIQAEFFKDILKTNSIKKLNKNINNQNIFWEFLLTRFKLRPLLRRIGVLKIGYLGSLSNYHILKAIEKSLKK